MIKFKAAVIGLGRMGAEPSSRLEGKIPNGWLPISHVEAILSTPGLELVALCDQDEHKLERFKTLYKIENGYSDQQPYDCIIIEGGVNHVPIEILNQLSENGRLVAVEIKEGNVGKAIMYQRYGKEFIKNYLFDAYVPIFDGFKKIQNFNF